MFYFPPDVAAPPPPISSLGPPKHVFYSVEAKGHQKRRVFTVWDVTAPMGRLVMCLGRLNHQNRPKRVPKGSLLMTLVDTFPITKQHPERDRSQVAFSLFFCCFLEGPTIDLLAPAQSKHSFSFSA